MWDLPEIISSALAGGFFATEPPGKPLYTKNFHCTRVILGRRQWHPTPVLLPGKSHGQRSLEGCSPWGHWVSDTTERLHFHFSLSCIGEGNGNPLQCSCLENPRDGGAWWAAVSGVAQSRTRPTWLSSSSSSSSGELYNVVGTDSVRSPRQDRQIQDQVGADQQILEMMWRYCKGWGVVSPRFWKALAYNVRFPCGSVVKNPPANAGDSGYAGSIPGAWKIPWRRKWQPPPVFLLGKSQGQRSLAGCSLWGRRVGHDWVTENSHMMYNAGHVYPGKARIDH